MATKVCTKCKRKKSLKDFYKRTGGTNGYASWCKICIKAIQQTKKSRALKRATDIRYRKSEGGKKTIKSRNRRTILKQYGMTPNDYDQMLTKQKGCCMICQKHWSEFKRSLSVDHNHETGQVRGLLCQNCNAIIGHAFDNPDLLQSAIVYLTKRFAKALIVTIP